MLFGITPNEDNTLFIDPKKDGAQKMVQVVEEKDPPRLWRVEFCDFLAFYSLSMVAGAVNCSNRVMLYHLVIGRPTSAEHSQYRFELTRFAISGLSMRE